MNHSGDANRWNVRFGKKAAQESAYLVVSCDRPCRGVPFFASTDKTNHCVFRVDEMCDTPRQQVQKRRLS